MTFHGLERKNLNLRDIEQGMEHLNRVRQNQVEIEILPGDRKGNSIVNLTASSKLQLNGSVSFDNGWQKSIRARSFITPRSWKVFCNLIKQLRLCSDICTDSQKVCECQSTSKQSICPHNYFMVFNDHSPVIGREKSANIAIRLTSIDTDQQICPSSSLQNS